MTEKTYGPMVYDDTSDEKFLGVEANGEQSPVEDHIQSLVSVDEPMVVPSVPEGLIMETAQVPGNWVRDWVILGAVFWAAGRLTAEISKSAFVWTRSRLRSRPS